MNVVEPRTQVYVISALTALSALILLAMCQNFPQRARKALYRAKARSRDRIELADPIEVT
ncbi:MAG: hypothetical protein H5U29_01200 [Pusillimonas sp.]|nr:hypothetical protein [Pusillimonas sp.]